jgi:hypothetical protein
MVINVIHRANSRGTSTQGWLFSRHTFSFGNYVNPDCIHFGALRAINDEMLAPGKGYGTHPHSNMEIITIPLEGNLKYKDDKNNEAIIEKGDIQILSAGTGIFHTEVNPNKNCSAKYLQIWILPNILKIAPQYHVAKFQKIKNSIQELINPSRENNKLHTNQFAWLSIGNINTKNHCLNYQLNKPKTHAVYIFIIEGQIEIANEKFFARDGVGITNAENIEICSPSSSDFLIIEVPIKV